MFGSTPSHASFNAQSGFDKSLLSSLQPAWSQTLGGGFAASPTVVNGILYFGGWNGYFYAIDGKDGRVLWQSFVGKAADPGNPACQQPIGVTAQAVVSGGVVYVGGGDSAVYALNKTTGEQIWRVPLEDPASGAYLWSSLTLVHNILYIGVASLGDCPLVRGALVRFDLDAPQKPLIRYLVPEDQTGGGIWSTPAVDIATKT
jgi:outer membrane protein assembly factor BamB